jgi:hypothetical protein
MRPPGSKVLTTMAKPGRNDPCPCGSGNKYKKCCLANEEAVAREQLAKAEARRAERTAETAAAHRLHFREVKAAIAASLSGAADADEDELTIASNAAAELVRAGKLDEAEQAARDLLVLFPDVHDGYDRLGMVYEARGDKQKAADCYRKVIAFIKEHPDDYEPGFEDVFVKFVDRLGNLPWCKPVNSLKEKLVRTGCVILECGRRIAAPPQSVSRNCNPRSRRCFDKTIGRSPLRAPFLPTRSQRPAQIGICGEQVPRSSLGLTRIGVEETSQYGEIVFGVVDRLSRIVGSRPANPSRAFCFCSAVEVGKVREPPLRCAHGLQRIK